MIPECISESDDEDTAHRLDDGLLLKRRLSEAEIRKVGGVGGNKNMNKNLGGKLFRSSKEARNFRHTYSVEEMDAKSATALARPHFYLGNLLQCGSRAQLGRPAGLQARHCCVKIYAHRPR